MTHKFSDHRYGQRFSDFVTRAANISKQFTAHRRSMNYAPVPAYDARGNTYFNGPDRLLKLATRVDNMKAAGIKGKAEREAFFADRDAASDAIWSAYTKMQGILSRGFLMDAGGDAITGIEGDATWIDSSGDPAQQYVTHCESDGYYGFSDDMSGSGDASGRIVSNGEAYKNGIYYHEKLGRRKSGIADVNTEDATYVSRPSDREVDRMFSDVDEVVGGWRVTTLGKWSTPPSDNYPNPVRERCEERGIPYLQPGRR